MADSGDSSNSTPDIEAVVAEDENDSSDNGASNEVSTPATTTVAHTFTPTVAGERGIFAPWPKKV